MTIIDNRNEVANFNNSFYQILSNVKEEEFMQMVMPLVHLLPIENIRFMLLNCSSLEVVEILKRVKNADILNNIASETLDPVVAVEAAKSDLIYLSTLNVLMDKFDSPAHLVVYSRCGVADINFLKRIKRHAVKNHSKEKDEGILYPFEDIIFENICNHESATSSLLKDIFNYVEKMIFRMKEYEKRLENIREKYKEEHVWSISRDELEGTKEYKKYKMWVSRVKEYYAVLLAIASNKNTEKELLKYMFKEYGKSTVYNIDKEVPGLAMQLLGYTNDDSIGYRVLMNPSIEKDFRDENIEEMLEENKGAYESGGDGEEYLKRVRSANNPSAVRSLYKRWCLEEDKKDFWKIGHASLEKFAKAVGVNKNAPDDVLDSVVERICKMCESRESSGKCIYYAEYFESIVANENLGEKSFIRIANALKAMEDNDGRYMAFCIPRMLIPLSKNKSIDIKSSKILFDLSDGMGDRGIRALCELARNAGAKGLDREFGEHKSPVVRANYATRSDNIDWLIKLTNDPIRDVMVAARRRYAELTNKPVLLSVFERDVLYLEDGRGNSDGEK